MYSGLSDRIAKLKAANNCRDGKHEWQTLLHEATKARDGSIMITGFEIKAHESCKHCAVKKDEFENKNFVYQHMGKNIKRTQPKPRKKGKK